VKFGHLIAGGILGGDVVQLLGGVPENIIRYLEGWRLLCIRHVAYGCLHPWHLGVMAVSPPVAVFTLVQVPRTVFGLRTHIPQAGLSVSMVFGTLAPLP
jgi:hypothetical protein